MDFSVELYKYCCTFKYNNIKYEFELYEILEFIKDYYDPDAFLCDYDGLCDLISILAEGHELWQVSCICQYINESNIEDAWFSIDYYNQLNSFNDMYDLNELYDIADIVGELIEYHYNELDEYCKRV